MKKIITTFGIIGIAAASVSAYAYTGEKLANHAKVTIEQARAIALKAYPGKITDEELEKEKGGSGLRYSFDIESDKTMDKVEHKAENEDEHGLVHEVGVDAKTGAVLENAAEGKNPD
jgi:uncharacterized membrane protein YkoI